jgi:hypothetical protein
MHALSAIQSLGWHSRVVLAAALAAAAGCSDLMDIPSNPKLVADAPPGPAASSPELPSATAAGMNELPGSAPTDTAEDVGSPRIDPPLDANGAMSSGGMSSGSMSPGAMSPESEPLPISPEGADAGGAGAAPEVCTPPLVDIVLIIDNSGSMDVGTQQAELALPSFALRLEQGDVDYRVILISRHRAGSRALSAEASTSVCVASPLSGLSACPAARPVPSPRFFQHSIKIDATDSFERVLEAATTPDSFGLTSVGWLEWLRPGARVEFVEITDDDSALSPEAFVSGLAELAPERFSATVNAPGFIFHSITGIDTRAAGNGNVYLPDEPIEPGRCVRLEGSPNNAGEAYQELSRATGGLRLPVCPSSALTTRLNVVASDVAARTASACPSN